jgi:predicted phosphodiesterase
MNTKRKLELINVEENKIMKIKYMSDLHLEINENVFTDQIPTDSKNMVLVLAGDICEIHKINRMVNFLLECSNNYRYVLHVPGNHCYYNGSLTRGPIKLMEGFERKVPKNYHFLNRGSVVIDDVKFIGATLWTDLDKGNPIFMMQVSDKFNGLNDYNHIRWGTAEEPYSRRLRPIDVLGMHQKDLSYIQSELTYDTRKTVVITHHAPLLYLLNQPDREYAFHRLNPAYGSHLENFVAESYIDLWIHGHVHSTHDNEFYGTRIVHNARGYDKQDNESFEPNAIIEL